MIRWLLLFAAFTQAGTYPTLSNLHYEPYLETVLDLIQPAPGALRNRPLAVVIHGSEAGKASKTDMLSYCTPFVDRGFVAANLDYRSEEDIVSALKWLRKNASEYKLDTRKAVIVGGPLALGVALQPDQPRYAALIEFPIGGKRPTSAARKDAPPLLVVSGDPEDRRLVEAWKKAGAKGELLQPGIDPWVAVFKWLKKMKV